MVDPRILSVLRELVPQLQNSRINWALVGSLGLALRGVPVEPHDIDIMTDQEGSYRFQRIFAASATQPVLLRESDTVRSHYGVFSIKGIKVEVMGDFQLRDPTSGWEESPELRRATRITFDGHQIPVLDLEWEYHAYSRLGRFDRAEAIKMAMLNRRR